VRSRVPPRRAATAASDIEDVETVPVPVPVPAYDPVYGAIETTKIVGVTR
jgi:hypothetical protein